MYAERESRLGGGTVVWSRSVLRAPAETRVLPDGCMDLIWGEALGGLLVAGPDTHAHLTHEQPGVSVAGVRFAPGTGPAVFGAPAHELRDQRVPLAALWPEAEVRRLTEYVAGAPDRGAALEDIAAGRFGQADPVCGAVVTALRQGRGVAGVAYDAGLSERQLHRRALDAFGYGPKTLARVLRMERALELARSGVPLVQVATDAGYADQAHLAREVKALAGAPLTVLLR